MIIKFKFNFGARVKSPYSKESYLTVTGFRIMEDKLIYCLLNNGSLVREDKLRRYHVKRKSD
jgi:hypothetical protein